MKNRPEHALITAAARTTPGPDRLARMHDIVVAGVDWRYLFQTASLHGVSPLLSRNLATTSSQFGTNIPGDVVTQSRSEFTGNATSNLYLAATLKKICASLQHAGIDVLPFKGPLLAEAIYGELAWRHFSDLDLLLRREDVLTAGAVLQQLGFTPRWTAAEQPALLRWRHQLVLRDPADAFNVELQWRVARRSFSFNVHFEDLWQRAGRQRLLNESFRSLNPVDLLLVLCVHGTKHCWSRLKWIVDISELLRRYEHELDWHEAAAASARLGVTRLTCLGLRLASSLLDARLPQQLPIGFRDDPQAHRLADIVAERLFKDYTQRPRMHGPFTEREAQRFYLQARERLRDKVPLTIESAQRLAVKLFVPTEHERAMINLPRWLSPAYALIRPARLAVKYGLRWLRPAKKWRATS